jgi:hypothetical protein
MKLFVKLDDNDVKLLVNLMKQAGCSTLTSVLGIWQPPRMKLLPVDFKLDGSITYLSWSRWIISVLAGRGLDCYLTGEENEYSDRNSTKWKAWRTTHMSLYTWVLNSMIWTITTTVDGIQSLQDIGQNYTVHMLEKVIIWDFSNWTGDRCCLSRR